MSYFNIREFDQKLNQILENQIKIIDNQQTITKNQEKINDLRIAENGNVMAICTQISKMSVDCVQNTAISSMLIIFNNQVIRFKFCRPHSLPSKIYGTSYKSKKFETRRGKNTKDVSAFHLDRIHLS